MVIRGTRNPPDLLVVVVVVVVVVVMMRRGDSGGGDKLESLDNCFVIAVFSPGYQRQARISSSSSGSGSRSLYPPTLALTSPPPPVHDQVVH